MIPMKRFSFYFAFVCLIGLVGCGDDGDNNTDVDLNIKMQYGDDPLVMYDALTYPDGRTFRITDVKGYFSEIGLVKDGATTEIKDVVFFSLGDAHSDLDEAQNGFDFSLPETGVKDFDALTFNIGITDEQNNTLPADYNSSNDLSKASEYWPNWESYIYFKIEGNMDFDEDGDYENGENVVLHLGTESALRNLVIDVDGNNSIEMVLDLEKVFSNNGEIYDMEAMPTIHASLSDAALRNINQLSDNLAQAFTVTKS